MKQKTKQAAQKRFTFSARGKVMRRHVHQSHFNSRDSGNETRAKRVDRSVDQADQGRIERLLPYGS